MDGYRAIRSRSDRIITSSRISCSLGACFLGFTLFTLSPVYIYIHAGASALVVALFTLSHPHCASACSCSLHTLPPSPNLNKTSLASLSPLTAGQRAGRIRPPGREGGLTLSPSAREGIHYRRSCSLSPSGGAGGPPTPSSSPPYIVWAERPPVTHPTQPPQP